MFYVVGILKTFFNGLKYLGDYKIMQILVSNPINIKKRQKWHFLYYASEEICRCPERIIAIKVALAIQAFPLNEITECFFE